MLVKKVCSGFTQFVIDDKIAYLNRTYSHIFHKYYYSVCVSSKNDLKYYDFSNYNDAYKFIKNL